MNSNQIDEMCTQICGQYHPEDICIDLFQEGYISYVMISGKTILKSDYHEKIRDALLDLQIKIQENIENERN